MHEAYRNSADIGDWISEVPIFGSVCSCPPPPPGKERMSIYTYYEKQHEKRENVKEKERKKETGKIKRKPKIQ
jgi:hypothetical protein